MLSEDIVHSAAYMSHLGFILCQENDAHLPFNVTLAVKLRSSFSQKRILVPLELARITGKLALLNRKSNSL